MLVLDINSDAVTKFATKTLKTMRRSALPIAVRQSLNSAAFDVKTNTMPKNAASTFEKRHNGDFFKANSGVDMAKGFRIDQMKATVGFQSHKLRGAHNYSIKDLEEQEYGGDINYRDFRPLDKARPSRNKPVRPKNRIELIKSQTNNFQNVIQAPSVKVSNPQQRFIRAAIVSAQNNADAYVMSDPTKNGKQILWRIDSITSNIKTKKLVIKATPLYSYKKNYDWNVKGTKFMRKASVESGKKLETYYTEAAQRQIDKLKK